MKRQTGANEKDLGGTADARPGRFSVERLAEELRVVLFRYAPAPGTQFKSISEICKEYGCSPVTSQKALKVLEQEGLLHSIKGSGNFVKELPKRENERRIGVSFLLPPGSGAEVDVAYRTFGDRVAEELRLAGRLVRHFSLADLQTPEVAEAELAEVDALVLSIGCIDSKTQPILERWGRPVVVIQHEDIRNFPFHQVVPDLRPGCLQAVRELVCPQTREVLVLNNNVSTHTYRNQIFCEALRFLHPDIAVREIQVPLVACDLGRLAGRALGKQILTHSRPLAAFSPSDFLSFGIIDTLREEGVALGKEVRLVSFDNLEGGALCPFAEPLLSSIENPREKVATEAARLALRVLAAADGFLQVVRVPAGFVSRISGGK